MKTINLMLDLESLSLDYQAVIFQISAVPFTLEGGLAIDLPTFNELISPISSSRAGAKLDADTLKWWFSQSDEVIQQVLMPAFNKGSDLKSALEAFTNYVEFLKKEHGYESVLLWGNGIKADNVWLESQYKLLGLKYPVHYRQDMDLRTLVQLGREFGIEFKDSFPFEGNKHNAIDDCKHQIKFANAIYKALRMRMGEIL